MVRTTVATVLTTAVRQSVLTTALAGLICTALAQSYPAGPVRLIVPFPAGGGVDSAGRLLAARLTDSFGKSFVIENRGGANGNIGTEVVAKSAKDGYILLFTGAGFVTNPSLYAKIPYDAIKDFDPISLMALGPNVLVVHPSLPVKSVKDLIALAKAKPGAVGFAGSGNGSTPHLAGELFNTLAGVQMVHIPYRGSGPAMIGVLSGETPVMFLPAINAGPHIKSGRLRAIAVTSTTRLPSMSELPTVAEAGLTGYESSQWYGVLAPAGTPEDVLNALSNHVIKIMQAADMKQRLHDDGIVPVGNTRQQFAAYIKTELVKWADVIKRSGARID